jgi:putative ABC transport system permease protein
VIGMNGTAVVVLGAVVALFAVALALKSQLASVIERRREMAILKAIGWTDGSIVRQILAESTLQALAGGALGALAAAAALLALPARVLTGTGSTVPTAGPAGLPSPGGIDVPVGVLGAGLLLVLLGGVVAGLLPALLAAREAPAAGLRRI